MSTAPAETAHEMSAHDKQRLLISLLIDRKWSNNRRVGRVHQVTLPQKTVSWPTHSVIRFASITDPDTNENYVVVRRVIE